MPDPTPPHQGIWSAIASAFRKNRLPCVLLNVLLAGLVASYYLWPQVAGVWEAAGRIKVRWSYLFAFVSTAFSAAVLPFAIQWSLGTLPGGRRWRRLIWLMLFWGYRGVEIDLLYRCQGYLFGTGNDAGTLAKKVALDQFAYSPLWAVPTYVIALRWIDNGGSLARTLATLHHRFWMQTYPTIVVTNWIVWIPAVAVIYSLPGPLQFPLFSVIMCFFVLVVNLLVRSE